MLWFPFGYWNAPWTDFAVADGYLVYSDAPVLLGDTRDRRRQIASIATGDHMRPVLFVYKRHDEGFHSTGD